MPQNVLHCLWTFSPLLSQEEEGLRKKKGPNVVHLVKISKSSKDKDYFRISFCTDLMCKN